MNPTEIPRHRGVAYTPPEPKTPPTTGVPMPEPMRVRDYTERVEKEISGLQDDLTRLRAAIISVLPEKEEVIAITPLNVSPNAGALVYSLANITNRIEATRNFVSWLTQNVQL